MLLGFCLELLFSVCRTMVRWYEGNSLVLQFFPLKKGSDLLSLVERLVEGSNFRHAIV